MAYRDPVTGLIGGTPPGMPPSPVGGRKAGYTIPGGFGTVNRTRQNPAGSPIALSYDPARPRPPLDYDRLGQNVIKPLLGLPPPPGLPPGPGLPPTPGLPRVLRQSDDFGLSERIPTPGLPRVLRQSDDFGGLPLDYDRLGQNVIKPLLGMPPGLPPGLPPGPPGPGLPPGPLAYTPRTKRPPINPEELQRLLLEQREEFRQAPYLKEFQKRLLDQAFARGEQPPAPPGMLPGPGPVSLAPGMPPGMPPVGVPILPPGFGGTPPAPPGMPPGMPPFTPRPVPPSPVQPAIGLGIPGLGANRTLGNPFGSLFGAQTLPAAPPGMPPGMPPGPAPGGQMPSSLPPSPLGTGFPVTQTPGGQMPSSLPPSPLGTGLQPAIGTPGGQMPSPQQQATPPPFPNQFTGLGQGNIPSGGIGTFGNAFRDTLQWPFGPR